MTREELLQLRNDLDNVSDIAFDLYFHFGQRGTGWLNRFSNHVIEARATLRAAGAYE